MIAKPHKLGTPAAAALYHKEQLVNPALGLGQTAGVWLGEGAAMLGLQGAVEEKAFLNVLAGRHPSTGAQQTAELKANRRSGYDWVVAPDKSISAAWGVGGDDRLAAAHTAAVQVAFQTVQRFAAARVRVQRDSTDYRITGNLVAAMFTHDTARPESQGAVSDVFLHSHLVIANLTFDPAAGEAGGWRALETQAMLEARALMDTVYNHELGKRLRELGYELGVGTDGKSVAIAGIPAEVGQLFSKRHANIEARAAVVLNSGAGRNPQVVKDVIAHQNRTKKDLITTKAELQANWRQQLVTELGSGAANRFMGIVQRALGRGKGVVPPAELTPKAFEVEYERLAERVAAAEKTPDRKLTPEEVALSIRDWKAFSKQRGYSDQEIAEYGRWLDLHGGFTPATLHWETLAELHQAIVADALANSRPASAKAVDEYALPLPHACVRTGDLYTREVTEAEALAWAVAHCFERNSVTKVGEVLTAALRYAAGSRLVSEAALRTRLETDERFIWSKDKERLTTKEVARREKAMVNLVEQGIGQCERLVRQIPAELRIERTQSIRESLELKEDAIKGCPTFTNASFRDVEGFLNRLIAQADPLSAHLWKGFSASIQTALLSEASLEARQAALVQGLNERLKGRSLFTPKRFADLELSALAKQLKAQEPEGRGLERLNRVLLEAAFRKELKPAGIQSPPRLPDYQLPLSDLCQKFSEAQRRSVLDTVENSSFLSIFKGGAGRGKSYALVFIERLLEQEGKEVIVAAPQTAQVNSLTNDRGRPAITVASLLATQKPLPPETVLLVDEAGQLGTQTMFALLCYAKQYNARVLLSGDTAQHSSVESGDSMRAIEQFTTTSRATLGTEVHEIKRQYEDWFRRVVALAEQGKPSESFKLLSDLDRAGRKYEERNPNAEQRAENARIFEFKTDAKGRRLSRNEADEERRRAVAAKAVDLMRERNELTDPRQKDQHTSLVISQTRKEVGILNEYIREEMVSKGLLQGEERVLQTLDPSNLTNAEKGLASSFTAATRLLAGGELCPLNNKALLPKGTVLGYAGQQNGKMVVTTADGVRHVLSKKDSQQLSVGQLTDLKVRVGDLLRLRETLHVGIDLPGQACKMPDGTVRRHTHKQRIANGSIVQVVGWNEQGQPMIEVVGGKPQVKATLTRPILANRGYAITSNAAQGLTVRFVLYSDAGSKGATNARQYYVDVSRAKRGIWVFTNDTEDLHQRIQQTGQRELALELLEGLKAPATPQLAVVPQAAVAPEPAASPTLVVPAVPAAQPTPELHETKEAELEVVFGPEPEVWLNAPVVEDEEVNPFLEGVQIEGDPEDSDRATPPEWEGEEGGEPAVIQPARPYPVQPQPRGRQFEVGF